MGSQVFNFPGFFDREIDLSFQVQKPVGIPAGVVGASERGPAFVPTTVGSFQDWRSSFGELNPKFAAPYAVEKHLANKTALTFIRILGAGGNTTAAHIETTRTEGTVNNAGFIVSSSHGYDDPNVQGMSIGGVGFLLGRHTVTGSEAFAQAGFTNNDSMFTGTGLEATELVNLVRAVILVADNSRLWVGGFDEPLALGQSFAHVSSSREFKLFVSSSAFTTEVEGTPGVKVLTASLDPESDKYFAKLLNTDPTLFDTEKHLLYADYAVDNSVAVLSASDNGDFPTVALVSGSGNVSLNSGDTTQTWGQAFGRFDTRYQRAKTPSFISQPFGETEYDLFHFEAMDDGAYPNQRFKVSISALKKSADPKNKFGSFSVLVRAFDDTDTAIKILEQYNNVNLDPQSENYICKIIGDKNTYFNFDVEDEDDRRLITKGRFGNKSKIIRVIASDQVERKLVPNESLPFGFRGVEALLTNPLLQDTTASSDILAEGQNRLSQFDLDGDPDLTGLVVGIIPPLPYRFKVTRGAISTDANRLEGAPGNLEITDARYYWGVKGEKTTNVLNPNPVTQLNPLVAAYTQFGGIKEFDVMVTGSDKDKFHNHKFSLARVALGNTDLADLTSSINVHMKEAAYIRNGKPDVTNYKITDADGTERITLASLLNKGTTAAVFNAYSSFAKYTCILQGGFDGVNILDKNAAALNDRASSTESRTDGTAGNSAGTFTSPGFDFNQNGVGITNNTINSYREAAKIITDVVASNVNVVAVPGQREPLVTNFYADKVDDFGLALYVMDIPNYDATGERIFDGETGIYSDPNESADALEGRAIDKDSSATYYPDIVMDDETNGRRVTMPASVAAVSALSFNDRVAFPWFAPAGFNRASLDFVIRTTTRINQPERVRLFDVHINPIVKFPREGNVIYAQNTLEQAGTALGSVNVIRMLNDVKRQVIDIGNRLLWEQISPELLTQLESQIKPVLSTVQLRQGIESFNIICDNTNNTAADRDAKRINCKIILVPTRAVEFISIDFIITKSGVSFV